MVSCFIPLKRLLFCLGESQEKGAHLGTIKYKRDRERRMEGKEVLKNKKMKGLEVGC